MNIALGNAMNIHIVGAGAVGLLFAARLKAGGHNVTLILSSQQQAQEYAARGALVVLDNVKTADGAQSSERFHLPAVAVCAEHSSKDISLLQNVVIATKAQATLPALRSISAHLAPHSTILLLQNGLPAVYQEVQQGLQQLKLTDTRLLLGSVTHGAYRKGPQHVMHAGIGGVLLGLANPTLLSLAAPDHQQCYEHTAPDQKHASMSETAAGSHASAPVYGNTSTVGDRGTTLLQSLLDCPAMNASLAPSHVAFVQAAYTKLATNCAINPLTALLRCQNGFTIQSDHARHVLHGLTREAHAVLHAQLDCTAADLLCKVEAVAAATAANRSSMLQDVENTTASEVDYISGHLLQLAQAVPGMELPLTSCMYHLVKAIEQQVGVNKTAKWPAK